MPNWERTNTEPRNVIEQKGHITQCVNEIVNPIGFQRKWRVERLKSILGRWAETKKLSFKINQYE